MRYGGRRYIILPTGERALISIDPSRRRGTITIENTNVSIRATNKKQLQKLLSMITGLSIELS